MKSNFFRQGLTVWCTLQTHDPPASDSEKLVLEVSATAPHYILLFKLVNCIIYKLHIDQSSFYKKKKANGLLLFEVTFRASVNL